MSETAAPVKPKKKLFGVSHPLGKAAICIAFIALTGGLGLIVLIIAALGDRARSKKAIASAIALLFLLAPSVGSAQTWAEQQRQQMYNQRAYAETEQFLLREEIESNRQQQERDMQERERAQERQEIEDQEAIRIDRQFKKMQNRSFDD